MSKRKWKTGFNVALFFGLLTAGSGVVAGMHWQAFIAVLCTSLATNLSAYLMKHPIEEISDDDTKQISKSAGGFIARELLQALGIVALMFAAILAIAFGAGCRTRPLDPGADPFVVRMEQFERGAKATLELTLKTDNLDRAFFKENIPAFHMFCEDLRAPVNYQPLNQFVVGDPSVVLPRWRVALINFDDSILTYKSVKSAASSNEVIAAQLALQGILSQANQWLAVATNLPKGTP